MGSENALVVFQGNKIRRTWHNEQWWFALEDIIFVLTESKDPKQYIQKMKQRDEQLSQGWVQIVRTLCVDTVGGVQNVNCANTESMFRIIQSIPSKKAEPFKRWLAKVGYERIQEIEDPELAQKRMREIYKQKGYSDAWIEKRIRGIAIRDELTNEWDKRGIKKQKEYSILTAEISKATFDVSPSEHKTLKGLKRENLRDHMRGIELIFSMLGEASTTEIAKSKDAEGFIQNKDAANKGGAIAGSARKKLELETGKKVVSSENYLTEPESAKRLKHRKT
ncbi:MAG: Bro-N domain-containing protein [archaeon]|nr:Bro-N domain-containing protein [archaeon]